MSTETPETSAFLDLTLKAAQAGADILASREEVSPSGLPLTSRTAQIDTKSSASDLVTEFDKRAEQQVRKVISEARPHDVISGEEYGTTEVAEPSGYRWSIDPLDGTTNFVHGVVYYGTSVGLQDPDGNWLVGVVNAPAIHRVWWAVRGQGAFTQNLATGAQVRLDGPVVDPSVGLLSTGFGYDPDRRQEQVSAVSAMLEGFGNLRRLGAAALDICMVADGTVSAYAEYGIQEHDWAAGALIAEEAGVPVRRPAAADGNAEPDWCIIGDLGVDPAELSPPAH